MKIKSVTPDPLACPLCGQANACVNLGDKDVTKSCWCNDPSIKFSAGLLSLVPEDKRGKACICKSCALKYQSSNKGN